MYNEYIIRLVNFIYVIYGLFKNYATTPLYEVRLVK